MHALVVHCLSVLLIGLIFSGVSSRLVDELSAELKVDAGIPTDIDLEAAVVAYQVSSPVHCLSSLFSISHTLGIASP